MLDTGHWIIWFYIILIFPFQVYDFINKKKHSVKEYVYAIFSILVVVVYTCSLIFSSDILNVDLSVDNKIYYGLLGVVYMQSVYNLYQRRTKRNICFFVIFTLVVLIMFIYTLL